MSAALIPAAALPCCLYIENWAIKHRWLLSSRSSVNRDPLTVLHRFSALLLQSSLKHWVVHRAGADSLGSQWLAGSAEWRQPTANFSLLSAENRSREYRTKCTPMIHRSSKAKIALTILFLEFQLHIYNTSTSLTRSPQFFFPLHTC